MTDKKLWEAPPDAASGERPYMNGTVRSNVCIEGRHDACAIENRNPTSLCQCRCHRKLAEAPPPEPSCGCKRCGHGYAHNCQECRMLEVAPPRAASGTFASDLDAMRVQSGFTPGVGAKVHSHVYVSSPVVPDTEGCRYPEKLCGKAKEEHE